MWISIEVLKDSIREGKYTSLGSYPKLYIMEDGGIICPSCIKANYKLVLQARLSRSDPQWNVVHVDVNWEGDCTCDNCYSNIESAY